MKINKKPRKINNSEEIPEEKAEIKNGKLAKKKKKPKEFKNQYIFRAYELAKTGASKQRIMQIFSVTEKEFGLWVYRNPMLMEAINEGHRLKYGGTEATKDYVQEYIYAKLPADLKRVWDKLESLQASGDNSLESIGDVLERESTINKQYLFIHALACSNFNQTAACSRIGISSNTLKKWKMDIRFCSMLDEIEFHKKNFVETALMNSIAAGEVASIIFASKTLNRDRGYNDREYEVKHELTVNSALDIDALELDFETKKKILEAVEKAKTKQMKALPAAHNPDTDIIDAEILKESE